MEERRGCSVKKGSSISSKKVEKWLNEAPVAIIVHQDERLLYANWAAIHLLGYTSWYQMKTYTLFDMLDEKDQSLAMEIVDRIQNKGEVLSPFPLPIRTPTGERILVEVEAARRIGPEGNTVEGVLRPLSFELESDLIDNEQTAWINVVEDRILNPITTLRGYLFLALQGEIRKLPLDLLIREVDAIQDFVHEWTRGQRQSDVTSD